MTTNGGSGNSILALAAEYLEAGISVIPLRLDGSKAPASHLLPRVCCIRTRKEKNTWEPYSYRLAANEEVEQWFAKPAGIALVCGRISGGLEVIDFDDGDKFAPWYEQVAAIVDTLPVVETGGGGWHVLYRTRELCGNIKIAEDPKREKQTLIETRGEGGYIVAEGSHVDVHASGLPYVQYSGPALPTVPEITPKQRAALWWAAKSFDLRPKPKLKRKSQGRRTTGDCPQSWADILEPHGWTTRNGCGWTRPGKQFGTSANLVIGTDGAELLTVFSANAGPLSPTGSYRTWNKKDAIRALEGEL